MSELDARPRPPATRASMCGMTTLPDRTHTALMVIDVQVAVVAGALRRDEVVAAIARLVDQARGAAVPVVWVQHTSDELPRGSEAWSYVPELVPDPSEPLIHKRYGDAFEGTELEEVLDRLQVGRLLISGAQTDACIRSTLHGALVRGYDTILIADAHTTEDLSAWGAPPPDQVIAHTNLYWSEQRAPGRTAGTLVSTDISFSAAPRSTA